MMGQACHPGPSVPLYEPLIPARYAAPLLDALADLPATRLEPALRSAGLDRAALRQPDRVLTFSQFDTLLNALSQLSGRTDLGFELGRKIRLEDHAALGVLLRRCGTPGEMLGLLARFSRTVSPSFSLEYRATPRGAELAWRPAAYMSPLALCAVEEIFAVAMHLELQYALGERLQPFDVYLSMAAPPHRARYDRLLPTRYHFSSLPLPEVRFVFPARLLALPIRTAGAGDDPDLGALVAAQQRSLRPTGRWSEWVALILREAQGCQPTREELAGLLKVSRATLARRLAAEGTNFRALGKSIRHRRACELLADESQSISQIAYRLGYSDLANFSHAFRAGEGESPNAYRLRRRSGTTASGPQGQRDRLHH